MNTSNNVMSFFKQLCKIPRESGNEEGLRKFLLSWAEENNLKAQKDFSGNLVIYKNATEGYENVPSVALQAHMDMVCVKTENSTHNFLTDEIKTIEKNGFLYAQDTSLGADNGIGIALIMALFTDSQFQHGPLEAILTFAEETGMNGAFGLDVNLVKSRYLINLDNEEEGVFCIGCAGGIDIYANSEAKTETVPDNWEAVCLTVEKMKGGHSGMEINKQRANAIQILATMLCSLKADCKTNIFFKENFSEDHTDSKNAVEFMLYSFTGGTRMNVIPSSAQCIICLPSEKKKMAVERMKTVFENLKNSFFYDEPDMTFSHCCSHCSSENNCNNGCGYETDKTEKNPLLEKVPETAFSCNDSQRIVFSLFCTPHGVFSYNRSIGRKSTVENALVQTSDNLAIVNFQSKNSNKTKSVPDIQISVRSLSEFDKKIAALKIVEILEQFGFKTETGNYYPSWTPNIESPLGKICAKAWEDVTGKPAVLTSIHAGVECGIINSKIPEMDSISLGPDLFDVHSVNEHLSIESAKRIYMFLRHMLQTIR